LVASERTLDPVTFEVLKNSFVRIVDEMAERILSTCYSFVIWSRDFSSALSDRDGNTVMQGSQDIASHVGTLHLTGKAVIDAFAGDIHQGDVFVINDPYLGGTHFNDVRVVRPIFWEGELIAYAQSNGHWADIGGRVPGSLDHEARDYFSEGLRIPPVRVWSQGRYLRDVARMIVLNTRAPLDAEGDLQAQAEATRVAEHGLLELVRKYGKETVLTAFAEVQDYVERLARQRVAELPDGTWETEDFIDYDPSGDEGMIRVRVKMTIAGDEVFYDLSGSDPCVGSYSNASAGQAFSALVAATKLFFPDLPLNSGFYRFLNVDLGPEGTVVNAPEPYAVTGGAAGGNEKIINSVNELWSRIVPERALACAYNLEYLLVGGRDDRRAERPYFMWYDWMVGGWGGRNGKDGCSGTAPLFGAGLAVQPLEGQERLCPVVTTTHEFVPDSGGPGRFRGGCGVQKGGRLTDAAGTIMSYASDRARSVTWGIEGGLPSMPHGLWLTRNDAPAEFLGAVFSNVYVASGDVFTRPSAGGGGFGDPLEREPQAVCDDVADGYVTLERARKDYGVVVVEVDAELAEYEVDELATECEREHIRARRVEWLEEDPESVATRYRAKELDVFDLVRRYGVILDWGTGELLRSSTETYRSMLRKRAVAWWSMEPTP
jgi:N-methylhydantoinase B